MSTSDPDPRRFVIDTWAWVEYLEETPAGRRVKEIVENPRNELYVSPIIIAELRSRARRRNLDTNVVAEAMAMASVVPVDRAMGEAAGETHARMRKADPDYPLADAFVLETARSLGAKVVTGDPHFRGARDVVFLGK
jgi:predicted nucleic acid-binding protein